MTTLGRFQSGAFVLLVLVAAACGGATNSTSGDQPSSGSSASQSSAVATDAGDTDSTPATEGSGPESPQPSHQTSGSISVASLPVGGGAVGDDSGVHQCVEVNWVGQKPIPTGITIAIKGFHTTPPGIFSIDGAACPTDRANCEDWRWTAGNQDTACVVSATQVADGDGQVILTVSADVFCPSQAICDALASEAGNGQGSSVAFSAHHLADASDTPSSSPSDSPTG